MEKKLINFAEVKFVTDDTDTATKTFSGYGAVFGNVDAYGDVIVPGAFKKSIKANPAPLMFLNHDPYSLPIGVWTKLEEDDFGLKVEGHFIDTMTGRDTYTASKSGAITGLSIGYRPAEVMIGKPGTNEPARTIKSLDLVEISVVTFPANGLARISDIKSFVTDDDYERELIRLGMEREEAKAFVDGITNRIEAKHKMDAFEVAAQKLLLTMKGL